MRSEFPVFLKIIAVAAFAVAHEWFAAVVVIYMRLLAKPNVKMLVFRGRQEHIVEAISYRIKLQPGKTMNDTPVLNNPVIDHAEIHMVVVRDLGREMIN